MGSFKPQHNKQGLESPLCISFPSKLTILMSGMEFERRERWGGKGMGWTPIFWLLIIGRFRFIFYLLSMERNGNESCSASMNIRESSVKHCIFLLILFCEFFFVNIQC